MIERRRILRTRTSTAARIIAGRWVCVFDCSVRNISTLGARLKFESANSIPNIFALTFDAGRTLRPCHVIWRTDTSLGVEFVTGRSHQPLTEARYRPIGSGARQLPTDPASLATRPPPLWISLKQPNEPEPNLPVKMLHVLPMK